MRKLFRIGRDVKSKRARVKDYLEKGVNSQDLDVRLQLIQSLIPLGLERVQEELEEEVRRLAGERYKRNGRGDYGRWGHQWGSISLGGQKVPIQYPRVRDRKAGREVGLESYKKLQSSEDMDEGVLRRLLHGLSCRRYRECCEMVPEVFGLSSSTLSRRFIRASEEKLKEFMERRLDDLDIVAIFIDGKTFQSDEMVIALGVTLEGHKVILGFVQTGTENARVCGEFLSGLLDRGLRIEAGVLCVMDGSRGIHKAVKKVFGGDALVQRCQWHKRENVLGYLPKREQDRFRRALQRAYEAPTYEGAKASLEKLKPALALINESALRSLEEGFEECLTLHRLGLFGKLGLSLKTSNCIESLMSQIGQKLDKVDSWKNSNQKQRWLATALLDIEPRLRRIKGYRYLLELRSAIQSELRIEPAEGKEGTAA